MTKRCIFIFLLLFPLLTLPVYAQGEEARCINELCEISWRDERPESLLDGSGYTHMAIRSGTEFTVRAPEGIGGLYLEFSAAPGRWTLTADGESIPCGENVFLHEYVGDLNARELKCSFEGDGTLCDIYVLSLGERPGWVQDWQKCWDRADVLVLPTHSDDDQLYFAGVIPYCLAQGARVQVAYLISHNDDPERRNELLDGLWSCGLRNYPVLGDYEDKGNSPLVPLDVYARDGITWENFEERQVYLYRRFRPQVVVCHATGGEYGHGAHKLYSLLATSTLDSAANPDRYDALTEQYGVWQVSKLYVHNLADRQIHLDLDTPLDYYNGRTAFQVSQNAFRCHVSQFGFYESWLFSSATAAGIKTYNPGEYGLYYSAVGTDSGNSFFDNIELYDAMEARQLAENQEQQRQDESAAAQHALDEQLSEQERLTRQKLQEEALRTIKVKQRRLAVALAAAGAVFSASLTAAILLRRKDKKGDDNI